MKRGQKLHRRGKVIDRCTTYLGNYPAMTTKPVDLIRIQIMEGPDRGRELFVPVKEIEAVLDAVDD